MFDARLTLKEKKELFIKAIEDGDAALISEYVKDRDIDSMLKFSGGYALGTMCSYTYAGIMAASLGHNDVIVALAKAGKLHVNVTNAEGETALFSAATNGHLETVKLLLTDPNTDINKACKIGDNPLAVAIRHRYVQIVECLLEDKRINKDLKDCFGRTPIEMVRLYGVSLNDKCKSHLGILPRSGSAYSPTHFKERSSPASSSYTEGPSVGSMF